MKRKILLFDIVLVFLSIFLFFSMKQNKENLLLAYMIDGEVVSNIPKQNEGYEFDEENSSCTNGVKPQWDNSAWKLIGSHETYNNEKVRTRCTLAFKSAKTVETVLGEIKVYTYTPDFTKSACDDETCESHEKGIFETTDADGTSYYYRGSVENNYVYFANRYWRIIRINGDGTIRMIYDGTVAHNNGESSTDRQISTTQFNPASNDNMYLGYMYTSGEAHGASTSSTIKIANDNFYTSVLSSYSQYIDMDAGFCGDRSTLNLQSGVGTGSVTTYNKGYLRVVESSPSLICENENDLYTISSSDQGNKVLQYPVGLISVDEVMFAGSSGGVFDGSYNHQKANPNNYLITGNVFWTMTPAGGYNSFVYTAWNSHVFYVLDSGRIDDNFTIYIFGIRPVINLSSDVTITGNGTKDNPYTLI